MNNPIPQLTEVECSIENGIGTVLLNRPAALNACTHVLRIELAEALGQMAADDNVRAVILSGKGRAFCAGADLKEAASGGEVEREIVEEYLPAFKLIGEMDKPVIAAVTGAAAGIGMSLALACDLLIMDEDAFLWTPFNSIGLVPDGGACWLLVRQLGYRRAFQIAVDGERISAERAVELGLANKVVAGDELIQAANAWADKLAQGSSMALAGTKKLMRMALQDGYEEVFRAEAHMQADCSASPFAVQALENFIAKSASRK